MSALKGPMDNFFKPKKSSTNSSNSNHPPISSNHLEVSHFVYQISNNLDILSRIKANKKKIPYKYEANYDLVSKGYPKGKAQAVALAKRVHGKHAVTVGDLRSTPNARGYWRWIQKDFKEYCDKTLFKDAPKESVYTPTRVTDGGTTRMAGHAFKSMMSLHNGLDCWMLFLDDRMSNGRDSTQRFGALAQFQKFTNYKKMRVRYLVQDLMRLYTIFDKSAQIIGIGILELHDIKDSVTGSMSLLKRQYGLFETYFYLEMLSHDERGDYIYDYKVTHMDHDHLEMIKEIKSGVLPTIIDNGRERKVITISDDDTKKCAYLSLRNDIIDMFID
eukprot:20737_1